MKKEWLLLIGSVVVTVSIALGFVRWLAPGLLGISTDLQLVQVAKEVPPFFENVFRPEDYATKEYLINDPVAKVRAKPLFPAVSGMGPNDLLGFRNHDIPNRADIVVIGDSQTYGNNSVIEMNWPSQMQSRLTSMRANVYNMSVGGWGAVQYLDMFDKAVVFGPKVVVVAFYTGNDSMESIQLAYTIDKWKYLQPGPMPSDEGFYKTSFPAPRNEWWAVAFRDGVKTIFTPTTRLVSNQDHPKVKVGYEIMAKVAEQISVLSKKYDVKVAFTIIPTKELVYAKKVEQENLKPTSYYTDLVTNETKHIKHLAERIKKLPGVIYIDVVEALQLAALSPVNLYVPGSPNGHPADDGYGVIAKVVADKVATLLPEPFKGLAALQIGTQQYKMIVVTDKGIWDFASNNLVMTNGWDVRKAKVVQLQDIAGLRQLGRIDAVDPNRFGPAVILKR